MSNPSTPDSGNGSEIAIIGMSGTFPGARNVDEYWQNLRDGIESISFFTDRELTSAGIDPVLLRDPAYVKAKGVLDDAGLFDASFFGYAPREAEIIDPQQRLFLESAWKALESAGYDPERYEGLIGVYAGVGHNNYAVQNLLSNRALMETVGDFQVMIGNDKDFAATRVSYKMNLKGPSVVVQTACSTSLVAVCQACQSLLSGECDIALAGASSVNIPQIGGYLYETGGITSSDGHCRAFDAAAQGTVFSNGIGIVVLKRLDEALNDGDCIHAVIKGAAVNNDGSFKVGFTAPSVEGQAKAIRTAQLIAETPAETITYVETHGTATALGDPIEVAGLTQAFRMGTQRKGFCAIGSVKTNIGHTDAAAGVAGLIKTVLMLKHRMIPPSLHFEKPNPGIDFAGSPFYVSTRLAEWTVNGIPRRAGVSSFGIGGTNAHVIVEEAPAIERSGATRPYQLLLLSAKSASALDTATKQLVEHLKKHPQEHLADVAFTLQEGRKVFGHRRMAVCRDRLDAVTVLGTLNADRVMTSVQEPAQRDVVFMFSGQGSQYVDMGLELYRTEAVFREEIDRCAAILKPHLSLDLRDILYPSEGTREQSAQMLMQTYITQPALFAIEYALAKLWMSWGVTPAAFVGHSIGEYVAACLSGVFSLETALTLVAGRARLMQDLPGGSMLAVSLSETELRPMLGDKLSLAVINGPSLCVVSGQRDDLEELKGQLSGMHQDCRYLQTSHAFHSAMMDPILEVFAERVKQAGPKPPTMPFLSNYTGRWITPEEAVDPRYWANHLRHTVRFSDCLAEILKEPDRVFLEVGPGHTFSVLIQQHPAAMNEQIVLSSIRHPKDATPDAAFILNTLGRLWLAGYPVGWSGFYADERRSRLPLPTYPFERKRYWIAAPQRTDTGVPGAVTPAATSEAQPPEPATEERKDAAVSRQSSRGGLEQRIADLWKEVLGVDYVGIHDTFYELGGTSLTVLRMFSRIEKIFGIKLPLSAFKTPTVGQLAEFIAAETGIGENGSSERSDA